MAGSYASSVGNSSLDELITGLAELLGVDVVEARAQSGFSGEVLGASCCTRCFAFLGCSGRAGRVQFVGVGELGGGGCYLAAGQKEVVGGLVVGISEETSDLGVIESRHSGVTGEGSSDGAHHLNSVFGGDLSDRVDYVGVEVLGAGWVVGRLVVYEYLGDKR